MERYLLDTMSVLWMTFLPEKIPAKTAQILCDPEADLSYSIVSLWEIGLKMAKGGFDEFHLPDDWDAQIPRIFEEQSYRRLEIHPGDCRMIQDLPFHHKDPFDRMMIAQALRGNFTVIGTDDAFDDYGVRRIW